jgi:hypothetical protein
MGNGADHVRNATDSTSAQLTEEKVGEEQSVKNQIRRIQRQCPSTLRSLAA